MIVVLTNREDSLALLLEAERQGLMTGEYVFFLVQHFEVSGSLVSKTLRHFERLQWTDCSQQSSADSPEPFPTQDNLWKYPLDNRINDAAMRAFDMTFIIGQKTYDGYEYYDFFEQVFERLRGPPFQSNLASESEVRTRVRWFECSCLVPVLYYTHTSQSTEVF